LEREPVTNPSPSGEDFLVDGTSLMTLAYAIQTISGRERLPPKIGDNIRIPYRHGRVWKPKTADEQVITLGMWVRGCDVNGVTAGDPRAYFQSNLRTLKRLFAPTGRQLTLQRKILYTTGMETHNGLGEAASQIDAQGQSRHHATFTVDIRMADPWWYGASTSTDVTSAGGTITNIGDVEATNIVIQFVGPLINPMLINTSVSPQVQLFAGPNIPLGVTFTLDCSAFTAVDNLGTNVIGNVSHIGNIRWMLLEPGSNVMALINGIGGGSPGVGKATVTFSPPYT
jgi:hypothetical protein